MAKRAGQPEDVTGARGNGDPALVAEARRRSMSERLELALSWNSVAAELRANLAKVKAEEAKSL